MEPKTRLFIIRHGEAWGAITGVVAGMRGDRGLTPLGQEQAGRLRDRLAATREIRADVLLASTFPRARQTVEIIAPALGLAVIGDDEFQELRPGEADGMSAEEYSSRHGNVDFMADPFQPVSPGGENWPQFVVRASGALHRVTREQEGKTIVIVAHGGIVTASFIYFFGLSALSLPLGIYWAHNTAITEWFREPQQHGNSTWRLVRYNDAVHLRAGIHWAEVSPPEEGAEQPAAPLPAEAGEE